MAVRAVVYPWGREQMSRWARRLLWLMVSLVHVLLMISKDEFGFALGLFIAVLGTAFYWALRCYFHDSSSAVTHWLRIFPILLLSDIVFIGILLLMDLCSRVGLWWFVRASGFSIPSVPLRAAISKSLLFYGEHAILNHRWLGLWFLCPTRPGCGVAFLFSAML